MKPKRFKGLLEWILDREGNEYLAEVDRAFFKDSQNLVGIKEQFQQSLGPNDQISDNQFQQYVRHLYKAQAPNPESLQDDKYLQFIQDVMDVYGLIHRRYICTPNGKSHKSQLTLHRSIKDAQKVFDRRVRNMPQGSL